MTSTIAKVDLLTLPTYMQFLLDLEPEEGENEGLHDKLHDKFPELSEKAFEVLGTIHANRSLNATEIGEQVGLSERQVKTYITKLKQAGLLVRMGSNKTGYWKVMIDEI